MSGDANHVYVGMSVSVAADGKQYSIGSGGLLLDPSDVRLSPGIFFDQNGDGKVTALDALRVINEIATGGFTGAGEGGMLSHVVSSTINSEFRLLRHDAPLELVDDDAEQHAFATSTLPGAVVRNDDPRRVLHHLEDASEKTEQIDAIDLLFNDWETLFL